MSPNEWAENAPQLNRSNGPTRLDRTGLKSTGLESTGLESTGRSEAAQGANIYQSITLSTIDF